MSMIKMTVRQCWDLGLWDNYCEYSGCNPYAINEGQINYDDEIEIDSKFEREDKADENVIEFKLCGSVYTGNNKIDLNEFNNEFIYWIESKGWTFCGIITPLEDEE